MVERLYLLLVGIVSPRRDLGILDSLHERSLAKGPSGNKLHSWVSDEGWLWSISMRKTGGIPQVFRGFFALKSAADDRQLTPKCASYFLTGPKAQDRLWGSAPGALAGNSCAIAFQSPALRKTRLPCPPKKNPESPSQRSGSPSQKKRVYHSGGTLMGSEESAFGFPE